MAMPAKNRKTANEERLHAKALPGAEITYSIDDSQHVAAAVAIAGAAGHECSEQCAL
jgi:hypothetical protein